MKYLVIIKNHFKSLKHLNVLWEIWFIEEGYLSIINVLTFILGHDLLKGKCQRINEIVINFYSYNTNAMLGGKTGQTIMIQTDINCSL